MNKTPEDRFAMLLSMLERSNKACKTNALSNSNLDRDSIDHNLSNVRCFPFYVEIMLKDGRILEINEHLLKIGCLEVCLDDIIKVNWITPEDVHSSTTRAKAILKKERFDYLYLKTSDRIFSIEGMGQAVFPVMKFINWAI